MHAQIETSIATASAIIFDMDGLLIDSEPLWTKARAKLLQVHGITGKDPYITETVGMGLKEAVTFHKKHFGFTQNIEDLMQEYRKYVMECILEKGSGVAYKGAKEFVAYVYGQKKPLAIATGGHSEEMVQKILSLIGLSNYFSVISTTDEVEHGKPAPDIYLLTAKKLHVTPTDCLVLEDATNGVKAAKAAGMKVIAVNKDTKWQKDLQAVGADVVVGNLQELL